MLGTLILWFSWYGFNGSSTLKASSKEDETLIGLICMNTTISATAAGCFQFFYQVYYKKVKSAQTTTFKLCMGILSGLVGITSAADNVYPWAAFAIGIVSTFIFEMSSRFLLFLKIDDPLESAPIHFFVGMWGLLSVGIFDKVFLIYLKYI